MEVLLLDDYPALGYVGDTVQVKRGHARNYLIPRGLAVDVGSRRAKEFQHLLKGVSAKRLRRKGEAEEFGTKISKETLSFELKIGANGKAFGSVGARDALKKLHDLGYELERRQVRLADPIKAPGDYVVEVQLHAEVIVEIPISVSGIVEKVAPAEDKKSRKRRARSSEENEENTGEDATSAAEGETPVVDESGEVLGSQDNSPEE